MGRRASKENEVLIRKELCRNGSLCNTLHWVIQNIYIHNIHTRNTLMLFTSSKSFSMISFLVTITSVNNKFKVQCMRMRRFHAIA